MCNSKKRPWKACKKVGRYPRRTWEWYRHVHYKPIRESQVNLRMSTLTIVCRPSPCTNIPKPTSATNHNSQPWFKEKIRGTTIVDAKKNRISCKKFIESKKSHTVVASFANLSLAWHSLTSWSDLQQFIDNALTAETTRGPGNPKRTFQTLCGRTLVSINCQSINQSIDQSINQSTIIVLREIIPKLP